MLHNHQTPRLLHMKKKKKKSVFLLRRQKNSPKKGDGFFVKKQSFVSSLRINSNGELKPIQISSDFARVLQNNIGVLREFYTNYRLVRLNKIVRTKRFTIKLFDPKDASSKHDLLMEVSLKGKKYFVKEVINPATPFDSHTQFVTHFIMQFKDTQLKPLKVSVLQYQLAVKLKDRSFLVADWTAGVSLERWLAQNPQRQFSPVLKRFHRAESLLRKVCLIKDVDKLRNAIYNPKTDVITLTDAYLQSIPAEIISGSSGHPSQKEFGFAEGNQKEK